MRELVALFAAIFISTVGRMSQGMSRRNQLFEIGSDKYALSSTRPPHGRHGNFRPKMLFNISPLLKKNDNSGVTRRVVLSAIPTLVMCMARS
ncbi:hypothetical protein EDB92DRAFT_483256 [Lactarius akahatsu]|uniref:Secreted protein n=1 Tax=Lactarius akahatsu TaxID=416441 RepID=A0AAD4QHL2_9AGAM|nr:hypothetical protein EDB92DRAFT_483256 [Lactarius akahatsu]